MGTESILTRSAAAASSRTLDAALTYATWISRKRLTDASNARLQAVDCAPVQTPIFVGGDDARHLYARVEREVRQDTANTGVLLGDRLHDEVVKRLERMKGTSSGRGTSGTANLSLTQVTAKLASSGARVVRGFASTDDLDRQGDIVVPRGMVKPRLPLPLLLGHAHDTVIGAVRSVDVRDGGVWIEADIVQGVKKADEVWALVEAHALDAFSIGFIGRESEPLPNGGRRWKAWELVEVSVVAVPANPSARLARSTQGTTTGRSGGYPVKPTMARADGSFALRRPPGSNRGYPLRARGPR